MSEGSWDTGPGDPARPTLKFKVTDKLIPIMPPPALSCTLCKRHFAQYVHLQQHSRSHSGRRPFKCHPCQQKFLQLTHLKKHRLVKHEAKKKCHACGIYLPTRAAIIRHIIQNHGVCALKLPKSKQIKNSPATEKPRLAIKLCIKKSLVINEEKSEDNSWRVKKRKKHKKHKKESRRPKQAKNSSSDVSSNSKPRLIFKYKLPKDSANTNVSKPVGQSVDSFQSSSEQKSNSNSANKPEQFSELVQSPSPKDSGIDDCSPLHESDHHENNSSSSAASTTKTSPIVVKTCKVATSVSSAITSSPALSPRHGRATRQDIALRNLMLEKDSGSFNTIVPANKSERKAKKLRSSQCLKSEPTSGEDLNSTTLIEKAISSPSPVPSLKLKISKKPAGKLRGAKYTSSLQVSTEDPVSPCSAISRSPRSTPAASPRLSKIPQSPISRKCFESSSPRTLYAADYCQLDTSSKRKNSPRQDAKSFGRSPRYMRMESTDTVSSITSEPPSLSSAHSLKSESDFGALNVHVDDPYAFDDSPCSTSPHLLPYTSTLAKRSRPMLEPPVLEPQIMPITSANQDSKPKNKLLSMKKGRPKTFMFGHHKDKNPLKLTSAKEKKPKRLKVTQCPKPTGLKPLLKTMKGLFSHKSLPIQKEDSKTIIQDNRHNSCGEASMNTTPSTASNTVNVSNATSVLSNTCVSNDVTSKAQTCTTIASCVVSSPVESLAVPTLSIASNKVELQCATVNQNGNVLSDNKTNGTPQGLSALVIHNEATKTLNIETMQRSNVDASVGMQSRNTVCSTSGLSSTVNASCNITSSLNLGSVESKASSQFTDNGFDVGFASSINNELQCLAGKPDKHIDIKDYENMSAVLTSSLCASHSSIVHKQVNQSSVLPGSDKHASQEELVLDKTSVHDLVNKSISVICSKDQLDVDPLLHTACLIPSSANDQSQFEKTTSGLKRLESVLDHTENCGEEFKDMIMNSGAKSDQFSSHVSKCSTEGVSKKFSEENCVGATLDESDLMLSDNQLADLSLNDSFLKLADDAHGDDIINDMDDAIIDNLSSHVSDTASLKDGISKKKTETDAIVVQLPSEMGMEPMSFVIDNDDSDHFGASGDELDLQSSLSSTALPSLAASNISELSLSVGHSSASSVSSSASQPVKQQSQQELCLASIDTDSEFADLQSGYSPSQNKSHHRCKVDDDHHESGFFDAFASFVGSKQSAKSLSHGYDSEFAKFINQKSAISLDSDAISNLDVNEISKTELQALGESHKKVHNLCGNVWRLLRSLFPALEVPTYMRGNSACATEALIDQVLDMINDEDPSRTHVISGPHTCCEPSISVCSQPNRCLSHIRSRVSQLLLTVLPDLSLPPDFSRTGTDVDELLRHVIQANVT